MLHARQALWRARGAAQEALCEVCAVDARAASTSSRGANAIEGTKGKPKPKNNRAADRGGLLKGPLQACSPTGPSAPVSTATRQQQQQKKDKGKGTQRAKGNKHSKGKGEGAAVASGGATRSARVGSSSDTLLPRNAQVAVGNAVQKPPVEATGAAAEAPIHKRHKEPVADAKAPTRNVKGNATSRPVVGGKATQKGHANDDDLFEHMLGDWGSGSSKEEGSKFKPGDAHEEVEGIGSMSAAAGALIATLGALVVFGVGTAAVMGLVVGVSKAVSAVGGEASTSPTLSAQATWEAAGEAGVAAGEAAADKAGQAGGSELTPRVADEDLEELREELRRLRALPRSAEVDARKGVLKAHIRLRELRA